MGRDIKTKGNVHDSINQILCHFTIVGLQKISLQETLIDMGKSISRAYFDLNYRTVTFSRTASILDTSSWWWSVRRGVDSASTI